MAELAASMLYFVGLSPRDSVCCWFFRPYCSKFDSLWRVLLVVG